MEQRTPAIRIDVGYVCGVCRSPYWIDSPTDVGCENGHLVPHWQLDALYGYIDGAGDTVRSDLTD